MTALEYLILTGVMAGFTGLEFFLHRAQKFGATAADNLLDLVGFFLLAAFTQPAIMWMTQSIGVAVAPGYANRLGFLPLWAKVGLLLAGDDMLQYWWHRASHSPALWPLHRAHHSAHYMSARMIYRNNFFYYLFLPALWMSGVLVYLGLGQVYLVYLVIKMTVITGAHSDVRWEEPLYKIKALAP
jgi:sterol desaturase/sphingolipid hydroxylase (fatty acid hydroxylase superfamily)